ncbi:biotin transporter BioY [Nocardioides sp. cx-173]|uniref:biotin transporter BioY n=1 Tax=Nocardioides sp. cx-173 TaxID=2898796 RepID=UPI001E4669B0|nr:biotin transporter BioY [Nocardioides sp. cx-173]MCD4524722.1 biotin transporter BioY [Nocardioides sp. cx-173]UGB43232.1 biotin transporter BioY [Nocardioides sp. cx-173]
MSVTETPGTRSERRPRLSTTDLALIAAFAALISACAYVGAIPVGGAGVPITLQSFALMLAGCLLGPVRGFLAAALYLGLGAIGLPVFAEHSSGLGVFTGASAGYLWSFPFAAALAGFLVRYVAGRARKTRAVFVFLCSLAGSVLVVHPMGIVGMKLFFDVPWSDAVGYDAPFWLGDLVKTTLVALIAAEVHRAFPQLLHPRR